MRGHDLANKCPPCVGTTLVPTLRIWVFRKVSLTLKKFCASRALRLCGPASTSSDCQPRRLARLVRVSRAVQVCLLVICAAWGILLLMHPTREGDPMPATLPQSEPVPLTGLHKVVALR